MHAISIRLVSGVVFLGLVLASTGCGGGGGSVIVRPITVSLPSSTVVVSQDGTPVIVPIDITSTSETALVAVNGLPTGIQVQYAASDTNPSGSLAFTASAATPAGTYMPTVTVNSAAQTASTTFTLIVTAEHTDSDLSYCCKNLNSRLRDQDFLTLSKSPTWTFLS
jgi:hypothetical protein